MLVYGALSGPLPKVGIVVAAALAAVAMLHRDTRVQALAMLGALVLAPILLLGDIWHSPQLGIVHRHPLVAAVGALIALAAVAGAAVLVGKRPELLAGAVIVALPSGSRSRPGASPRTCSCRCISSSPPERWRSS